MQHDLGNFGAIDAIGLGIEELPLGHQVLLVIGRQRRICGRQIRDMGVKKAFA